jgi:hypothetical protein
MLLLSLYPWVRDLIDEAVMLAAPTVQLWFSVAAVSGVAIPTFLVFGANLIRSPAARSETVHSGGVR